MNLKLSCLIFISALFASNASAAVVSYQMTGIFDVLPEVSVSDEVGEIDTAEWDFLPQLFGAAFTLTFDIDEDSPLTGTSGGGAAFFNFDGAASNVSLHVQGSPFASAGSGDVRQVLASASHTWSLDAEGALSGAPMELFDFIGGFSTGYTVDQALLNLNLIDSDKTAFSAGADPLIRLDESVFLGDAPVGFITDALSLFLSGEDGDVFVEYNISGTISSIQVVPLPAAVWLLLSALGGLMVTKRSRPE